MTNIYSIINVSIELTCLSITASLLISILLSKGYKTKLTRVLLWILFTDCVILLCDAVAWGFAGRTEFYIRPLLLAANFFVYVLGYIQPVLIAYYIVTYISGRCPVMSRKIIPVMALSSCLMIGVIIASQFTGWLYSIDENNWFVWGPWSAPGQYYTVAILLVNIGLVLRYRNSLESRDQGILLFFLVVPVIAVVAELFIAGIMLLYIATTIAAIVLYVSIQVQQDIQSIERETALKTAVMLSQIQPHFLYNALASIEYLCERDAGQAGDAVRDFSKYLRGNLDSLSHNHPIPFEKELEHVRVYLALEKKRFEERLQVEFDIQAIDFSLPALTLQSMVENAVRHGVTKRDEGGQVTVQSQETADCWRVTVFDDGIGFDTQQYKQDGRTHVGIDNTRHRLETICGGALEIRSTPGAGTVAVLSIPKGGRAS